jgi:site-specific DNA-cytosine methylase
LWPEKIDLIIGGSPCQGFSFAGKQLAFDDPRSKLFFKFVEILNYYKPKYFLLENVRMKKEFQDVISKALGVEPICINSSLVSAQNRVRYYWTNIPGVIQPENKNIFIGDIGINGTIGRRAGRRINALGRREDYNLSIKTKQRFEPRTDNKSGCLTTVRKDNMIDGLRYLSPIECERLQTLPDNYTEGVSNTQRHKMLGNAWTIDVLAHIFRGLL